MEGGMETVQYEREQEGALFCSFALISHTEPPSDSPFFFCGWGGGGVSEWVRLASLNGLGCLLLIIVFLVDRVVGSALENAHLGLPAWAGTPGIGICHKSVLYVRM